MKAHDVRNLRFCATCQELAHKSGFVSGRDDLCVECAFKAAGSLDVFMATYPATEWAKLPLSLVGADGMRRLLALAASLPEGAA